MKHRMTKLLALLLAALLLAASVGGMAETSGELAIEEAASGKESGSNAPAEDVAPDLSLTADVDGIALDQAFTPADAPADTEVSAAIAAVTLGVGQKYAVNTKKLGKKLTFTSSKPKVAEVNRKGVITAKKKGTAVVTCTRNKKEVGRWKVTVKPAPRKVTLNLKKLTIGKGEYVQLIATTTKGSVTTLKWKSADKQIVSVDKSGMVKGRKPGTAKVTVTTHNGLTASAKVTVKAAPKKVTLSAETLELKPGATQKLKVNLPEDTASYSMTWTSSDERVAKIIANGGNNATANAAASVTVKAVSEGTATITATAFNGRRASCEVEVAQSFDVPIDKAHFPDDYFREFVHRYDQDGNGKLSRQETGAVKEMEFKISRPNDESVKTLKGIEHFRALEVLKCYSNGLQELDVSRNTALRYLDCSDNALKKLDLSGNAALSYLDISVNRYLKKLDVSKCTKLKKLISEESGLEEVTIGGIPALEEAVFFWCDGIKKLDMSGCRKLKELVCPNGDDFAGDLKELNLGGCESLEKLSCVNNKLTKLDVSQCTRLKKLNCHNSSLKQLDVSMCPNLAACLTEGKAEEEEDHGYMRYTLGNYELTVDKGVSLTPAPKA